MTARRFGCNPAGVGGYRCHDTNQRLCFHDINPTLIFHLIFHLFLHPRHPRP